MLKAKFDHATIAQPSHQITLNELGNLIEAIRFSIRKCEDTIFIENEFWQTELGIISSYTDEISYNKTSYSKIISFFDWKQFFYPSIFFECAPNLGNHISLDYEIGCRTTGVSISLIYNINSNIDFHVNHVCSGSFYLNRLTQTGYAYFKRIIDSDIKKCYFNLIFSRSPNGAVKHKGFDFRIDKNIKEIDVHAVSCIKKISVYHNGSIKHGSKFISKLPKNLTEAMFDLFVNYSFQLPVEWHKYLK